MISSNDVNNSDGLIQNFASCWACQVRCTRTLQLPSLKLSNRCDVSTDTTFNAELHDITHLSGMCIIERERELTASSELFSRPYL